jgi:hypothetical protein
MGAIALRQWDDLWDAIFQERQGIAAAERISRLASRMAIGGCGFMGGSPLFQAMAQALGNSDLAFSGIDHGIDSGEEVHVKASSGGRSRGKI